MHEIRKTVTVLFCDVTGSTALGERVDPETLRRLMRRYFDLARTVLQRHGGTVEKFIGDAVVAVFGIPQVHEDDALRAVRAATELREALGGLNEDLERERGVRISCRTGVNTGEVIAGDPTEGQSFATGDTVNVAARLEQAAAPDEILLGEPTYRLVRDAIRSEPIEPLSVKGKDKPVAVYRLLEVLPDVPAFTRPLDAPFIGRARELATLMETFERAKANRTFQRVTIVGPAGIGKSRLARELLAALGEDARVLVGRCLPYGEGITYWPLAEIVRQLVGTGGRDAIAGLLADDAEGSLAATQVAGAVGLIPAEGQGEQIPWAVRRLFEALAGIRPLVVVLDDVHWAEPTFLDLIEYLTTFSADAAILTLCSARPDLLEARPGWSMPQPNAQFLALEPLPDEETQALMIGLLAGSQLTPQTRARIAAAAEGNPLFVEQMLAFHAESGDGEVTVPPTIQALLAARIDRLAPNERAVIERAAVEGRGFHRGAVAELLPPAERSSVGASLMSLVRKQLIRPDRGEFPGEDGFRFAHILVRDAAYETVSKELRAELHERYAGWLERRAGERLAEYEEILGYHLERAYRYREELGPVSEEDVALATRAAERLWAAGLRVFDRDDWPASGRLLARASALLPSQDPRRAALLIELGRSLGNVGKYAAAVDALREAGTLATAASDRRLELHARLGRTFYGVWSGAASMDQLRAVATETIPIFEEMADDVGLFRCWNSLAYVHAFSLHLGAELEAGERALVLARRISPARVAFVAGEMASGLAAGPLPVEEALRRCQELLGLTSGHPHTEVSLLVAAASLEAMRGRLQEAKAMYLRATAVREELGMSPDRMSLWSVFATWGHIGEWDTAERELRAIYDILVAEGSSMRLSRCASLLGEAVLAQGRTEEAVALAEVSRANASREALGPQIHWRKLRGKLLARLGEREEAQSLAREAVELASRTDCLNLRGETLMDLAEVLRLGGRTDEAAAVIEDAIGFFERKGNRVSVERGRTLLTQIGNR